MGTRGCGREKLLLEVIMFFPFHWDSGSIISMDLGDKNMSSTAPMFTAEPSLREALEANCDDIAIEKSIAATKRKEAVINRVKRVLMRFSLCA